MCMSKKYFGIIPHSLYGRFSVIRDDSWGVKGVVLKEIEKINVEEMVTSLGG